MLNIYFFCVQCEKRWNLMDLWSPQIFFTDTILHRSLEISVVIHWIKLSNRKIGLRCRLIYSNVSNSSDTYLGPFVFIILAWIYFLALFLLKALEPFAFSDIISKHARATLKRHVYFYWNFLPERGLAVTRPPVPFLTYVIFMSKWNAHKIYVSQNMSWADILNHKSFLWKTGIWFTSYTKESRMDVLLNILKMNPKRWNLNNLSFSSN